MLHGYQSVAWTSQLVSRIRSSNRPRTTASPWWRIVIIAMLTSTAQVADPASGQDASQSSKITIPGEWEYSSPFLMPEKREDEPSRAQKDPTLVLHAGKWHVFTTSKLPERSAIEYCSFTDWDNAQSSKRTLLTVSDSEYFCAPQVFYFRPHKLWYLIYQMAVPGQKKMWVAYSTTKDISDPLSWTKAKPILDGGDEDPRTVGGLDYWIICDEERAYLFFTSLNGRMWRMSTTLEEFPMGFSDCQLALRGPVFEASHTYRIKGSTHYLTIIEQSGQRHYKAYVAEKLSGDWTPLADTANRPFAGAGNSRPAAGVSPWADNISHGELVRFSNDERLVVDAADLRFVFQGMLQRDKQRKGYGDFNWKIGILTPRPSGAS